MMRNKWYVLAAALPGALLVIWALALWMKDNNIMALLVGGVGGAVLFGAYRISQSASFAPTNNSKWNATSSAGVNRWLDSQADDVDRPAPKS